MDITLVLVTLLSLLVASVMTAFTWRLAQEERRRQQARISALAAEIHFEDWPLRDAEVGETSVDHTGELFSGARVVGYSSRVSIAVAVGIFLAGSVAIVTVAGGLRARANAPAATAPARMQSPAAPASVAAATPLELTALTHDRDGDRLTVRGVIRNSSSGHAVDRLTAVVFLFNQDGEAVGDASAVVDAPALAPKSESHFVVSIPNAAEAARYRISFRTDDRVIPHIDRRGRAISQAKQP